MKRSLDEITAESVPYLRNPLALMSCEAYQIFMDFKESLVTNFNDGFEAGYEKACRLEDDVDKGMKFVKKIQALEAELKEFRAASIEDRQKISELEQQVSGLTKINRAQANSIGVLQKAIADIHEVVENV